MSTRPARSGLGTLILSLGLALLFADPAAALCLPPTFESGQRLHGRDETRVSRLALLFRQHELCWRTPPPGGELRVLFTGNSGIYGFPLAAPDTVAGLLNRRFAKSSPSVHFFNAGHVYSDQLKDALILREALGYRPDLIVHSVVLEDFRHIVPLGYAPLRHFYDGNADAVRAFHDREPEGLTEPLGKYRDAHAEQAPGQLALAAWRQTGLMARLSVLSTAGRLRDFLAPPAAPWPDTVLAEKLPELARQRRYNCAKTHREWDERFQNWREWNILRFLRSIERENGTPIVILNWPIAFEPQDDCYNVRFTRAALDDFNRWLAAETKRLGFVYLDYHDLLEPEQFFDSLHATSAGQQIIAERIAVDLESLLSTASPSDSPGS